MGGDKVAPSDDPWVQREIKALEKLAAEMLREQKEREAVAAQRTG